MTDESPKTEDVVDVAADEAESADTKATDYPDEIHIPATIDEFRDDVREGIERFKQSETVAQIKRAWLDPVRNLRNEYGGRLGAGLKGLVQGFTGAKPEPAAEKPKKPARRRAATKKMAK
ncbi:MAG: hypothetical protein NUW01_09975 [Gemmatimonadaceae bacterium]|nr:hypothetical protein [Gemmatimonadaceae bacterium]